MAKVTLKPTQAEEPMPEVPLDERLKINCNIAMLLQSISVVNFWSQGFSALVGWWMKGCSHRELNLFSSPNRLWVCSLVFKCVACQRQKQTNKRRMLHTVVMNKYKLGAKDAWAARKQPSHRSNENWQPTQVVRKSLTIHEWPCERVVCNGEICRREVLHPNHCRAASKHLTHLQQML